MKETEIGRVDSQFDSFTSDQRRAVVAEFLGELSIGVPDEMRVVYAQTPEITGEDSRFWVRPLNDASVERLDPSENLYFCIGATKPRVNGKDGKPIWPRTEGNIGAGLVIGFDDIGTKSNVGLDFFTSTLPPTTIVESSPGNFQLLYFLDKPILDEDEFGDVLDSIITPLHQKYGIDKLADANHVFRLPWGVNSKRYDKKHPRAGQLKYPDAKGKPWKVRLIAADYDARYSPQQIAEAYGLQIVRTPKVAPRPIADFDTDNSNPYGHNAAHRAFGFVKIVEAFQKAGLAKRARSNGEKWRISCPWEGEHETAAGDSAFIADPAASKHGHYTFGCRSTTCVLAKENDWRTRTFDAAVDKAGIWEAVQDEFEAAANDEEWCNFILAGMRAAAATAQAEPAGEEAAAGPGEPPAASFLSAKEQHEQGERARQAAAAQRDKQGRERSRAIGAGEEDASDEFPTQRAISVSELLDEYVLLVDGKRVASLANPRQAMAFSDFEARFSGSFDLTADRTPKRVQRTKRWLDHGKRKSVWSQTFDPSRGAVCMDPKGQLCQNLWRPIVRPHISFYEDFAQPFFDHIEYLIPVEYERNRFLDWLAHIEQFPGVLPHTHYLMIAKQTGIGRNLLAGALVRLWRGYVASSLDMYAMLKNGYNGQLAGKLLFIADEIHAGSPSRETSQMAERMNMMFTEYERLINPKYGRQHVEFNCCRGLLLSNHIDATPILGNDRREIVIRNPDERKPPQYYTDLYAKLEDAEFIAAIGLTLRARDISGFNPGGLAPMNEIKGKVISAGRSEVEKAARDIAAAWPSDCISSPRFGYELASALGHEVKAFSAALTNIHGVVSINKKVRVRGAPTRVWILRNAERWEGEESGSIAAEVLKGEWSEALAIAQELLTSESLNDKNGQALTAEQAAKNVDDGIREKVKARAATGRDGF